MDSSIKAGVIVTTKFCKSTSNVFSSYINYIDREEAARTENSCKYNLYQDYMDNPEKTSGLFTQASDQLSQEDKDNLKKVFQTSQDNDSLMWQTVISFDNRWLEKNGLYNSDSKLLDENRLKGITRSAIKKMLENENLQNAVWSAAIHYNTDNIHVHIATVEPEPMRESKEYVQYKNIQVNGETVKEPLLDQHGNPITKKEYKGRFKQSSIKACKSEVVNQVINQRENNIKINNIIRESIVKQKKEHPLATDKDLCKMFEELYNKMPDCNRNMWNYNNPIMQTVKKDIDELSMKYIEKYHSEEYNELKNLLSEQSKKYQEAYGGTSSFAQSKLDDLKTRMGNQILKELREYDKAENELKKENDNRSANHNRQHRTTQNRRGQNLSSSIRRLKNALNNELEKSRADREHDRMVEQNIEQE